MAVFYYKSKTRFIVSHSPTGRPIWMKFGRDLSLHGLHLWVQFHPDQTMRISFLSRVSMPMLLLLWKKSICQSVRIVSYAYRQTIFTIL